MLMQVPQSPNWQQCQHDQRCHMPTYLPMSDQPCQHITKQIQTHGAPTQPKNEKLSEELVVLVNLFHFNILKGGFYSLVSNVI